MHVQIIYNMISRFFRCIYMCVYLHSIYNKSEENYPKKVKQCSRLFSKDFNINLSHTITYIYPVYIINLSLFLTFLQMRKLMTLPKFIPQGNDKIQLELSQNPSLTSFQYLMSLTLLDAYRWDKMKTQSQNQREASPGTLPTAYFNSLLEALPQGF